MYVLLEIWISIAMLVYRSVCYNILKARICRGSLFESAGVDFSIRSRFQNLTDK